MILTFLKGLLMGFCDIIPGVSGGTIAFITGIYERLMNAVAKIDKQFLKYIFKGEIKKAYKRIDASFLIVLFLGIGIAIVLGSRLMSYLLENYFAYTISLFIGLILASAKVMAKEVNAHKKYALYSIIGLIIGVLFAYIIPLNITPNPFYIFVGGIFGIAAMFLPGISGAFILLIMGLYKHMIYAIKIFDIVTIIVFLLGAVLGALTISRIINYLFKHHRNATFYFLIGLVIGATWVPIQQVLHVDLSTIQILISMVCLVIGFIVVELISRLKN